MGRQSNSLLQLRQKWEELRFFRFSQHGGHPKLWLFQSKPCHHGIHSVFKTFHCDAPTSAPESSESYPVEFPRIYIYIMSCKSNYMSRRNTLVSNPRPLEHVKAHDVILQLLNRSSQSVLFRSPHFALFLMSRRRAESRYETNASTVFPPSYSLFTLSVVYDY